MIDFEVDGKVVIIPADKMQAIEEYRNMLVEHIEKFYEEFEMMGEQCKHGGCMKTEPCIECFRKYVLELIEGKVKKCD